MRIISGTYGGRRLQLPKGRDIRPTGDKVRGAILNALSSLNAVEGAQVMDVFCGTGALGLEALSRGAADCIFVDNAKDSIGLAKTNAQMLGAEQAAFIFKDAAKLPPRGEDMAARTLVFLDPPYGKGLIGSALAALCERNWLAAGAVCVIEEDTNFAGALPEQFTILSEKIYGDTKVLIARYS